MIAILLPTYNQAKFLPDALTALAKQTYRDFEIIVCDDGSTDGTADWISNHLRSLPVTQWPRFLRHVENLGTAAAINTAFAWASKTAEYITWVSSDNIMYPNWLATLAAYFDADPGLQVVYSAYHRLDLFPDTLKRRPRLVSLGPYKPWQLSASSDCGFGPSFLVRRGVWLEHRDGLAHDYDWCLRIEEQTRAIAYCPEPLCEYRMGPWQTGRNRPGLLEDGRRRQAEALERRCSILGANVAT